MRVLAAYLSYAGTSIHILVALYLLSMASSRAQALKSLMESIHNNTANDPVPDGAAPPPSYEETVNDAEYDSDCCPDGMNDEHIDPHFIQVDASTSVSGSGNVIHADFIASTGAKAAAAICTFLKEQEKQRNQAASSSNLRPGASAQGIPPRPRPVRIGLNISVRIAGGRNLIACPSHLRPAQSAPTTPTVAVQQPSAEGPRSQAGSEQVAEEVAPSAELQSSASMSRPQVRSQHAAEEAAKQTAVVADEVEVAQLGSKPPQESLAAVKGQEPIAASSASIPRKRKAQDDDDEDVNIDEDVLAEARKRSRVAEEPHECLGGAE